MTKYTTVSIPAPLADNIKKQIIGTGFTSVSDYVTFVLREVLSQVSSYVAEFRPELAKLFGLKT